MWHLGWLLCDFRSVSWTCRMIWRRSVVKLYYVLTPGKGRALREVKGHFLQPLPVSFPPSWDFLWCPEDPEKTTFIFPDKLLAYTTTIRATCCHMSAPCVQRGSLGRRRMLLRVCTTFGLRSEFLAPMLAQSVSGWKPVLVLSGVLMSG